MSRRQLELFLRQCVLFGATLVILIPAARGSSAWIGWLPLWLVGMPLVAWLSLLRLPRPRLALALPRRHGAQARRWRARRATAPQPSARRA